MKKVLLALLAVVVLILVGTQLTPTHWKVTRSNFIQAKPAAIYPLIADWKNWDKWTGFKMPGMEAIHSGKPSGVGAVCDMKVKGKVECTNEIMKADPKTGIVFECRVAGWNPCAATLAFSPEGVGTTVTYTYEGDQTRNPIHRTMNLFVDKMLGAPMEVSLANLKGLVEKKGK